ncbi:hypothetical protein MOMA_03275 [Moraxella macacae 0408225]|uniref:Uncharacterized protein n=1 Tax=Moraxella macacae 0408225 TaxID=1230338 RepID=L2F9D8_9GAMM|nr:hypothetical protein MOMA_03275 [Moraxella macacae 0408225]
MKINFKPLAYQLDAVQAVVDVFSGQETKSGGGENLYHRSRYKIAG